MLSNAQIERYSRQVLLPDVGGAGQERLLASRVAVLGRGNVVRIARDLLQRAGTTTTTAADDDVGAIVDLGPGRDVVMPKIRPDVPCVIGRFGRTRAQITVLVGAPCACCVDPTLDALADPAAAPSPALDAVVGSLAAAVTLTALLGAPSPSTRWEIDLEGVGGTTRELDATGCPVCQGGP